MGTEFNFGTRWKWAGVIVMDDEGNVAAWEIREPQGMVKVSHEVHDWFLGGEGARITTRIGVSFEGDATEWDQGRDVAPGDHTPRTLGLIGHPDSGKTALGNIIKGLNERPMLPPGERGH